MRRICNLLFVNFHLSCFARARLSHATVSLFLLFAGVANPLMANDDRPPNVLFIAIDDLNDYALGLNPDFRASTPHMDRLAARGTLFTNAHCAAPGCNPSRASVMTGVAPFNSGVYVNSQDWRKCGQLRTITTLPQHFRDKGYHVIGGGKLYHAANLRTSQLEGFLDPRPWHEYFPSKSRQLADEVAPPKQAVNGSNEFYGGRFDWDELDITDDEMGDGKVVSWAESQLAKEHDRPLFLGVGIYRPHIPWYTPKKYFESNPIGNVALPHDVAQDLEDVPSPGVNFARQPWHDWLVKHDKWEDATRAYLASVSFADAMVGRLIKALDDGPLADNTIVVLWSDHGYHLGHKKHWEKFALWSQATHVPMIVVDRRFADSSGRCDRPVSLLDLYPTLAELCELDQPTHLDGESLVPFMKDASASSDRAVVITHEKDNHAVQSQHWRYIRYSDGSEELYDHRSDPGERTNLALDTAHAQQKVRLAQHLPKSGVTEDPALTPSPNRLVVSLGKEKQLATFSVSNHSHLKRESVTELDSQPGASLFDRDGNFLYVATASPSTITVFKAVGLGFEQVQSVSLPAKPSFLELTPDGQHLIAPCYSTGEVTVNRVSENGLLSDEPLQTLFANERAHSVAIAADGKSVFISHTLPNSISQFQLDPVSGQLSANKQAELLRESNTGPRHLRFHPGGEFAYGSDEQGCSVSVYRFDAATGTLAHRQTISSLPADYDGKATTSDIEVHPNGRFVYIANRIQGSIAVFAIDEETFELTKLQTVVTERVTRSFNISPTGEYLVAGGHRSGNLVAYRIAKDGMLSKVTDWQAGKSVSWVSFFPCRPTANDSRKANK